jgi:ubiquitin carboxyl-terminal hydrolase 22/27/51
MWCASEHFAGYEQQDAHEFLVAMLAAIYSSMREPSAANTATGGDSGNHTEALGSRLVRTPSLGGPPAGRACQDLSSIFAGLLRSEVTCARCRHRSVKTENFSDISLDLTRHYTMGAAGMAQAAGREAWPDAAGLGHAGGVGGGMAGGGEGGCNTAGGAAESLTGCLRAFTGVEQLSSDERCWCDKCGSLQDS